MNDNNSLKTQDIRFKLVSFDRIRLTLKDIYSKYTQKHVPSVEKQYFILEETSIFLCLAYRL